MTADDDSSIRSKVDEYYSGKLREHWTTARGVDWNSPESQAVRFGQLLAVVTEPAASLLDYGSGYGALVDQLAQTKHRLRYTGFDISQAMVAAGRARYPRAEDVAFTSDEGALQPHDFAVASGLFNVKLDTAVEAWERYVGSVIKRLDALSTRGFSFNMLTSYSDEDRKRADLYYGDPCRYFDLCRRRYSRNVALLHDYGLWEFTIIVRK